MTEQENTTRGSAGDAAVIARFPSALREGERGIRDAAAAVERGMARLADRADRLADGLGALEPISTGRSGSRVILTQAALRSWIGRHAGLAPRIWPGLGFEVDRTTGQARVIVARRHLAIVWDRSGVENGFCARMRAVLASVSPRLRPVGLRAQLAALSGIPRNAYVHGLPVDGEIVDAWD